MTTYLGDIDPAATLNFKFCTVGTTGVPTLLTGSQVLSVYKDSSTASVTTGVTLTTNFASVTGSNHVTIDTSTTAGFYAAGSDFQAVLTAGTVGGTSVAGYCVGQFSIQHRSPLRPTVANRALDVSAGGEAGVDWANVGSQSTAVTLSATSTLALQPTTAGRTLDVTTTGGAGIDWANVENQSTAVTLSATSTLALQPTTAGRTLDVTTTGGAGIDWANVENQTTTVSLTNTTMSATQIVASVTGAVGGAVGSVTGNVGGNVVGSVGSVVGAVGSVTGNVGGNVVGSVGSVTGAVGSVTGNVGGNVVGSIGSVASGGIVTASIVAGAIVTGSFFAGAIVTGSFFTGAITAGVVNASENNAIADALLARNIAGGSSVGRIVSEALYPLRNKWDSSTTGIYTVYAIDDTTVAWTSSLSTNASADPLVGSDPS